MEILVNSQASNQFAPLGWFHGAKNTFNIVSDTYVSPVFHR